MRQLLAMSLVVLAASAARAQPATGSALDKMPVCGVDYMGPCLPPPVAAEEKKQAKAKPAASTDAFARTAFDEFGFGGNDPLIQAWTASEAAGRGAGIVTASAGDEPPPPQRDSVRAKADRNLNEDRGDGRTEISPDARHAGSRMDPVHTQPRQVPLGQTLVAVVAPDSATAQLNWITIRSANGPAHASEEEAHNYNSGLWDHAPARPVTKDPQDP